MSAALFPLARSRLDAARALGRTLAFWWRDDDANRPSEPLTRLLALRRAAGVPLVLAVIPEGVEAELAEALPGDDAVAVLLHGWRHANHAPEGQKRAEFGDHRPIGVMLDEAAAGRAALAGLFPGHFLPVFVPPWNRIGEGFAARLGEAGLNGLSTHGRTASAEPHRLNAHLDLMNWREARGLTPAEADRVLAVEIDHRLNGGGAGEPIGLLSHHLQHDEAAWALLDALLDFLAPRSELVWPPVPTLFDLPLTGGIGEAGARADRSENKC
ncbi:polysaccharide deacetylase [Aurantimonas sp. C2-6-R+9]|uniref:polysaccharide deacetylase n=1 Tax=unclassified Aurantimonas TaxID=2638230 RepID=UPI002E17F96D|nr:MULTISPECIES: polysaccharide deacetylase [unclassified Aurantimonas]MEC5289666.1 polysaccharide deacetylase [Aurantimonas sp. C2-3-R2]MEC5379632.1 polysaccharide deacetylase [Aurantimonas sp. C2-6-R+9]MEC5410897.1 polysaccharide deacetylase [Aurantimonas sp. C2-4-R8]